MRLSSQLHGLSPLAGGKANSPWGRLPGNGHLRLHPTTAETTAPPCTPWQLSSPRMHICAPNASLAHSPRVRSPLPQLSLGTRAHRRCTSPTGPCTCRNQGAHTQPARSRCPITPSVSNAVTRSQVRPLDPERVTDLMCSHSRPWCSLVLLATARLLSAGR